MKRCMICGKRLPDGAVLIGGIEQGSGPGIPIYQHSGCTPTPRSVTDRQWMQTGIRRAP